MNSVAARWSNAVRGAAAATGLCRSRDPLLVRSPDPLPPVRRRDGKEVDPPAASGLFAKRRVARDLVAAVGDDDAVGMTGPDLTHVGSRQTLAAGLVSTNLDAFRRWIAGTELLKPGVHMPAFANLPNEDLAAISAYLVQLK